MSMNTSALCLGPVQPPVPVYSGSIQMRCGSNQTWLHMVDDEILNLYEYARAQYKTIEPSVKTALKFQQSSRLVWWITFQVLLGWWFFFIVYSLTGKQISYVSYVFFFFLLKINLSTTELAAGYATHSHPNLSPADDYPDMWGNLFRAPPHLQTQLQALNAFAVDTTGLSVHWWGRFSPLSSDARGCLSQL